MYKIIGANQAEYGPVSAEQLRQWITEGRADANTMAQAEGTTEWKPLRDFPEFAGHFAQAAPTPPPPFGMPVFDESGRSRALQQVNGPGIGLMITAALGFGFSILGLLADLAGKG